VPCLFALWFFSVAGCSDSPIPGQGAASPGPEQRSPDSGEGAYQAAEDQLSFQKAESGILPPDVVLQIKPRCRALVIAHEAARSRGIPAPVEPGPDMDEGNAERSAIIFVDRPAAPSAEDIAQTEIERQLALRRLCEKLGFIRQVDHR
jgi:hypothetical protein